MTSSYSVSSQEVQQARAYLFSKGIPTIDVNPRDFAESSKKLGKNFDELLRFIALLKLGGQGVGQSPVASRYAGSQLKGL